MVCVRKYVTLGQGRIIPQGFGFQQMTAYALHVIKE